MMLAEHLALICTKESIDASSEALAMIARAAEGSVRDSLSLLDQAATMTADALSAETVANMLGRPGRGESQAVLTAALAGDVTAALTAFANAYAHGAEPEMLIADLLDLIHLASMHAAGAPSDDLIDSDKQTVADLADVGIARLGRAWQLLLKGHGEVTHAPDSAAGCEMLIIRLAHAALMPTPSDILKKLPAAPTNPITPPSPATLPEPTPAEFSRYEDSHNAAHAAEPSPADQSENHATDQPEMPQSLIDIVKLAEANNEKLLAARIRNHVRLVGLQPGSLEIALAGNAPDTLAGDLAKQLGQWTGQRWLVSLSDKGGAKTLPKTLAEESAEAAAKVHDAIAMNPLVTKIIEVFPGATIDAITPAPRPETDPQNADDTASVDDEEVSR